MEINKKSTYNRKNYEKHKDYMKEFNKNTYRCFIVKLNKTKDEEIIKKMESLDNKNDYIRKLIQKDIDDSIFEEQ
jgi:hypothetical protein